MTKEPFIPMLPEEVPQQQIHLIVDLAPRPTGFQGHVDWIVEMPKDVRPKGSPRNIEYLGSVEWAWSPMHSRIDAYYLNPRGRYWLLWKRYYDDNFMEWTWSLYAYGFKKGVTAREAAIYLLIDAWSIEKDKAELDHFHWINDTGTLSISDIKAIARVVWPE